MATTKKPADKPADPIKKQTLKSVKVPSQGGTLTISTPQGERKIEVAQNKTGPLRPSKEEVGEYKLQSHYSELGWEIVGITSAKPNPGPVEGKGLKAG